MQKKAGLLPGMTDASGALLAFRRVVGRKRRQPAAGKGLLHTVWIFVLCSCGDLAFPRGTFFAEAVTSQSSAEEQFNPALTEQAEEEDLDDEVGLEMEELADILEKLVMSRKDTKRIFGLIDGNSSGKLTLAEFFKGVRLFAPSVMLEGIRLQLIQNSCSIADSLCSVVPDLAKDRRARLDRCAFASVLSKLQVQCEESHIDLIFEFLDVRDVGSITLGEMIAALQNIDPGSRKQVDPGVREERAEHFIKSEMAPFHKTVTDLKRRVRQGLKDGTEDVKVHRKADDEQHGRLPRLARRAKSVPPNGMGGDQPGEGDAVRLPEAGARLQLAEGPPRSATAQGPQCTYYKLHSRFKRLPNEAVQTALGTTMSHLKGYFNSAHSTLQDQKPVLARSYTRIDLHTSTEILKDKLDPHLVEFRKQSDAARL